MSIVIGIINEKGVTISADTKLANIKIPTQYQSGLKKIFHFQLDGLNYIFGCAGPNVMELITFLRILQKYPFTLAEGYSQKDFMKCIQTILKDNKMVLIDKNDLSTGELEELTQLLLNNVKM